MVLGILAGATAVGKSALALELAERNGAEIISADSRQIYRGLAVGTGVPTAAEAARVAHHLVGFKDPAEAFSSREFPPLVHGLLSSRPEARFFIVGGTGQYLKELLYPAPKDRGPTPEAVREEVGRRLQAEGSPRLHAELALLDPAGLEGVHPNDAYRVAKRWENYLITGETYTGFAGGPKAPLDARFAGVPMLWLDRDRPELYARIDARVEAMARSGWVEEARRLAAEPLWSGFPAANSLGYPEMTAVAEGRLELSEAVRRIQKKTRNYAKRQTTFFGHQFPGIKRWRMDDLLVALDQSGWNWEDFKSSL